MHAVQIQVLDFLLLRGWVQHLIGMSRCIGSSMLDINRIYVNAEYLFSVILHTN